MSADEPLDYEPVFDFSCTSFRLQPKDGVPVSQEPRSTILL
ncbi:hypothetical protein GCWU000246_00071 [Jonquetella anthropi E3_33 E1]|nr:hypothetical protein GCWU000246_00071 [Jonquetella anthropi E3_33 E1]